jgi:CYTH domain-containing protein
MKEVIMQQSPVEVERKWLVQDLPDLANHEGKEVIQGYIAIAADGTEVRLRQTEGKFFQTVKSEGGLIRDEIEIKLTQDQFEALWRATAGRRLKKTRYTWHWAGQTVEIDVYHGFLAGLMVAEVEFPSAHASARFAPPPWCGMEVTEDKRYKNASLALHGRPPQWQRQDVQ